MGKIEKKQHERKNENDKRMLGKAKREAKEDKRMKIGEYHKSRGRGESARESSSSH